LIWTNAGQNVVFSKERIRKEYTTTVQTQNENKNTNKTSNIRDNLLQKG